MPEKKDNQEILTIRDTFRKTFNLTRRSIFPSLMFSIIHRVAVALILVGASYLLIQIFKLSLGQPFLNDQEILSFVLSIPGIIVIIGGFLLFVLIYSYEQCGLMAISSAYDKDSPVSAISAHHLLVKSSGHALRLGLAKFGQGFRWALPLLGVFAVIFLIQSGLNFSLANITKTLSSMMIPIFVLGSIYVVILFYLLIKWTFAHYALIVEGLTGKESIRSSATLTNGHFWSIAKVRVTWFVLVAGAAASVTFLLSLLNEKIIFSSGENLIFIFTILAIINLVVVAFLGVVIEPLNINMEAKIFREFRNRRITTKPSSAKYKEWLAKAVHLKKFRPRQHKITSWIIIAALIVGLGYVVNMAVKEVSYLLSEHNDVAVTAHRGYSAKAPENTISAFKAAADAEADYAELDVQLTKDGQVVVFHDDDLKRITGIDGTIGDKTLAELKGLDAGKWFSDDFAGEKIPTLEETMKAIDAKIKLNIEIKDSPNLTELSEKVATILTEQNWTKKAVVTSFKTEALKTVESVNPQIRTGQIGMIVFGDVLKQESIDFLSLDQSNISLAFVRDAHKNGKDIHAWTVNVESDMKDMLSFGVDNVITDKPELFIETQKEYIKNLDPRERLIKFLSDLSFEFGL
jgi:glycerophosphoryl diester phosphodiesterase